jgi:hypothetical protein
MIVDKPTLIGMARVPVSFLLDTTDPLPVSGTRARANFTRAFPVRRYVWRYRLGA